MSAPSKAVTIVDDDPAIRTSLSRLLLSAGYQVATYPSANAFLEDLNEVTADCLLLDVHMEGLDGLQLQSRLQDQGIPIPVVFLTGHGDIPMSVRAIKHGAIDFLTKPVDEICLFEAIETAIAIGKEQRLAESHRRSIEEKLSLLSPRELEVLRCLLSGALNKQAAAHLGIVEKTVKVHRARILEKLEIHSIPDLVRLCSDAGLEPIPCVPE